MSVGSGIPVALTQGNREELYVKDPPVPQSAILYLLQEATKLALPEARLDSPDSMVMDGIWSGEGSEQHKLCPSPSGSASASHFGHRGDNYADPRRSFKGSFSLLPTPPGSSPWEVMSLINLQCERLLHPEDREEDEVYEGTPSATGESKSRNGRGCHVLGRVTPALLSHRIIAQGDVQPQSGPRSVSNNSNCQPAAQHPEPQERLVARRSELHESCVENVDEEQLKLKANRPASDARWQARKPRKQSHPTRSADLCDPTFKGVTFRMRTELSDNRDQCRLLITSNYSAELLKSIRRVRGGRSRSLASSLKTSSSEEDSDSSSLPKNKKCASCDTRKTPLWRDAEDGTPLCNACGIRYKKYRVRCFQCWHIPRKEGNTDSKCFRCGDALRLVTSQRKLTGW
ncbi:hypothetical protein ANANG_G00031790 [Anguilla anguilla]|uniref:GATA-type domain-containing protein n=1 Tax=Anguilla anguilla TaxID=7936 RepID=A0A9D3S409_ANGAN|nr:hypothetical protein ANANG_G00031790 [Anguilla anguilla]